MADKDTPLDDLLDSALEEWDDLEALPKKSSSNPTQNSVKDPRPASQPAHSSSNSENEDDARMEKQFFEQDPISERFASELQDFITNLEKNPDLESLPMMAKYFQDLKDLPESFSQMNTFPQTTFKETITSPQEAVEEMLQNSKIFQNDANPPSDFPPSLHHFMEDFMGSMEDSEMPQKVVSMAETMLKSLLDKDIIYEPLTVFVSQYRPWIESHRNELAEDQLSKCSQQLDLCTQIITCYDHQPESNSELDQSPDLKKVSELINQLQELGQPPREFLENGLRDGSDIPFPFSLDPSSLSSRLTEDPENCAIM